MFSVGKLQRGAVGTAPLRPASDGGWASSTLFVTMQRRIKATCVKHVWAQRESIDVQPGRVGKNSELWRSDFNIDFWWRAA